MLSPATIVAVDLAALSLLDLPCLVAFILGVLADEFGWVAKSFPVPFEVRVWGQVDWPVWGFVSERQWQGHVNVYVVQSRSVQCSTGNNCLSWGQQEAGG